MAFTNRISQFLTKIAFGASPRLYGRFSSGAGVGEEIGIGDGLVIESGSLKAVSVNLGNLTTSGFTTGHMLRIKSGGGLEGRTTAQVLSDIGAQAALTNYSTVTGLTGFPGTSTGGYGAADSGKMAVFGSTGSLTISTGLLVNSAILGNTFVGAFTPRYIAGTQTVGANAGATWTISAPEFSSPSDSFVYNLPSKSGTFAMTSDIPSDVVRTSPQTLNGSQRKVAKTNISVTRESAFPGLRLWALRPGSGMNFGVVSDSTASTDAAWVRQLGLLIAAASPDLTVDYTNWYDASGTVTMTRSRLQQGASGLRSVYQNSSSNVTALTKTTDFPAISTVLDLRCHITCADWSLSRRLLTAGWASTAWFALRISSGNLLLQWAPTVGTLTGSATSSVVTGFSADSTKWVRAVLDTVANNVKFYTSTDGETWTQLGTTVSGGAVGIATAGAANDVIYMGSAESISGITGSAESLKWHEVQIMDGVTGQILAPTMPDQWAPNYTDRVTYSGSPVLSIYNASQPGADTAYWTEARMKKILPREMSAVIYALGTNDTYAATKDYAYAKANFDTWLARVRNVTPGASVISMTQNPLGTVGDTAEHSNRFKVQPGYLANLVQVAKSYGFPVIDAYSALLELGFDNSWLLANDAFHPNGTAQQVWAGIVFDAIFTRVAE